MTTVNTIWEVSRGIHGDYNASIILGNDGYKPGFTGTVAFGDYQGRDTPTQWGTGTTCISDQYMDGIFDCGATGEFLWVVKTSTNGRLGLWEVYQFAEYDLAQHSTICSSDGASSASLSSLTGQSTSMMSPPTIIPGSSASVTFSLQHVADIEDVWIYTYSSLDNLLKVTLIDDTGAEQQTSANIQTMLHKAFSHSVSGTNISQVRVDLMSGTQLEINKVAIFTNT